MANMVDYVKWRGDLSFQKDPFNEVDSLILSQIVYLEWKGIIPGVERSERLGLKEAERLYFRRYSPEELEKAPKLKRDVAELLRVVAKSRRYENTQVSKYVNEIDKEQVSQFSAMKMELEDGSVFLSFSGTDNSMEGWKENFNMSYLPEVPGQIKGLAYVHQTVPFYKNKLRFGGHSKGGNIAVYAAMHVKKSIQNRLLAIYNHDGPGFTKDMISEEGYQNILTRIHTYVPQSSIIGMLLDHAETIEVIESVSNGILQHDPFTWQIEGTHFLRRNGLAEDGVLMDRTMTDWLQAMDASQKKQFIDAFFLVLEKAKVSNTDELLKMNLPLALNLLRAAGELSPENRDILIKTIMLLFEIGGQNKKKIQEHKRKLVKA